MNPLSNISYQSLFSSRALPGGAPAMSLSHKGDGPPPITFVYGLPDPASFPVEELIEATRSVLGANGNEALQYGPGRGFDGLLQVVADKLRREEDLATGLNNLMLANGSSQSIELMCHVFVDPGDTVIVEVPCFIGALATFRRLGARPVGIPLDDEGIRVDVLATTLAQLAGEGRQPKFLYTVPHFHNPGGVTMNLARRRELLRLAAEYNMMILEDDAYRELCYEGEPLPSLYQMDQHALVVRLGTFSKILAAGMRIGWILAPEQVIDKIMLFKFDTGTNHFACRVAAEYCRERLESHIVEVREIYRRKLNAMLVALDEHVGKAARWTRPQGGFYVWMELSDDVDPARLAQAAAREGVAYLPGQSSFVAGDHSSTMRLSFSYPGVGEIEEGIRRLGRAIQESIK